MINEETGRFSIKVPTINPVKQGEALPISVSINRGNDFKQDVKLNLKAEGFKVSPESITVKLVDKPEAKFNLTVPKDTKIGDHAITVNGTPNMGNSASAEFTLKVLAL